VTSEVWSPPDPTRDVPACKGKSFEHHERTEVTDAYGSRWRCPDCGDSGTFEALFTALLALQPMFERALEHMLADRVMFLVPSEATPGHLAQCFGRPVHRVRGIDGPVVAFSPSPLDVTVAQAVTARAWQAEAEASS
jgi:hypothetical protein